MIPLRLGALGRALQAALARIPENPHALDVGAGARHVAFGEPRDGARHVGQDAVRAAWEKLFAASPDAVFTTEEIFAAGDRVVARWRYDYGGGHVRGVDLFTVRDGLVAEKLSYVKG